VVKFQYRHEDSPAALAPNWRRVLLVDGLVGVIVLALGLLAFVAWNTIVGGIVVLLGLVYVFAVVGRYRTWRAHRQAAGLDG
jgi:hypothetical protein